jgi:hypothetical protein
MPPLRRNRRHRHHRRQPPAPPSIVPHQLQPLRLLILQPDNNLFISRFSSSSRLIHPTPFPHVFFAFHQKLV